MSEKSSGCIVTPRFLARFSEEIKLSSRHNWLYGEEGQYGQTNTPGGVAHVFWEESRYFLKTPLMPGDQLDLRKRETDTAAHRSHRSGTSARPSSPTRILPFRPRFRRERQR